MWMILKTNCIQWEEKVKGYGMCVCKTPVELHEEMGSLMSRNDPVLFSFVVFPRR